MSNAALSEADLASHVRVAKEAVEAASAIQMRLLGEALKPKTKDGNPRDLVTEADLASDQAIKSVITAAFPDEPILSEEDGYWAEAMSKALRRCWLIDPPDGTLNFVHRFPFFGPAIAFVIDNAPQVAAVAVPKLQETFTAAKGSGAFFNGQRIQVAEPKPLDRALLVTHMSNAIQPNRGEFMENVKALRQPFILGSPLISMCYLAAGRIDVFATLARNRLGPWDMAPAVLIAEEAGATVCGQLGAPLDLLVGGMAGATTENLLDELWATVGQKDPTT